MSKINPKLEKQLQENPEQEINLIVRTNGDASPHLEWLASAGFKLTQQFKLSPGVAVSGTGQATLKLILQSWVISIELDMPLKAMD